MKRRRIAIISTIFLISMLVLTFFSRTIYHATLPSVCTSTASGGTLKYTFDISNFTAVSDEPAYEYIPFLLNRGLTITRVFVQPGDIVKCGSPIATFYPPDGEYLIYQIQQSLGCPCSNSIHSQSCDEIDRQLLDYLTALQRDNWTYRACNSGIVCSNEIITNQVYLGVSPICTIAKAGNPILLEMKLPSDRITQVKSDWNWQASLDTYSGQIDTWINHVDCQRIQVTLPSEVNIQDIASVRVTCESMYYPTLIPTSALHTNKVYVIDSSFGDWGQPVYTVRSILVELGESDQEYTGILGSFSREHRIIISSSDPLVEGQIVIPDHFE